MHVAILLRGSGSASGTAITSSPVQGQEQTDDLFVILPFSSRHQLSSCY